MKKRIDYTFRIGKFRFAVTQLRWFGWGMTRHLAGPFPAVHLYTPWVRFVFGWRRKAVDI